MIYIVERHVEDYLHVLANVSLIKIIRQVYSKDDICFKSAQKHSEHVHQYFERDLPRLTFEPFKNRNEGSTRFSRFFSLLKKTFDDVIFFNSLIKKLDERDLLFISHIYPHSLVALNLLKVFHLKKSVFVILHGEVEYVFFYKSFSQKLIGLLYKISFLLKSKKLNFILLTKASEGVFQKSSYLRKNEIISIELPTFTEINYSSNQTISHFPIKIGHIGSAGLRKNVHKLYSLALKNADLITNKKLELSVVGVLEESIKPHLNDLVLNYVGDQINSPLSRQKYDLHIRDLQYAVFFYDENDFLLRSSAAVFDAVFYEKPIIALTSKFFENLFSTYGEMGYLCENLDEMDNVLKKITSTKKDDEYNRFINNINAYKDSLDTNSIALDLKRQLQNLCIK